MITAIQYLINTILLVVCVWSLGLIGFFTWFFLVSCIVPFIFEPLHELGDKFWEVVDRHYGTDESKW